MDPPPAQERRAALSEVKVGLAKDTAHLGLRAADLRGDARIETPAALGAPAPVKKLVNIKARAKSAAPFVLLAQLHRCAGAACSLQERSS